MNPNLLLVGEPLGLLIAKTAGPLDAVSDFTCAVAGAELNVAVGMSRLEHSVSYLTKLGDDPFGRRVVTTLRQNEIDTSRIFYGSQATGMMLKGFNPQGDPEIFYYRRGSAASTLCGEDLAQLDLSGYTHLHLTGIFPALSPSTLEAARELRTRARQAGLFLSFDPNLRPSLWKSQEEMREVLNGLAAGCDLFLPGEKEGLVLCGSSDPDRIADFYLERGVGTVVVKLGARGAYCATRQNRSVVPGYRVNPVDTVGAGDGFACGVLSGLMEGLPLADAVLRGNAIGAIQVTCKGDNEGLPTRAALEAWMAEHQPVGLQ